MSPHLPHLQLDPASGVPIYRQVMDQVRAYAAAGVLKPGDQLPSIRDLAKVLRVNPTTVVRAYGELEHAGVIDRQHGRGVFVAAAAAQASTAAAEAGLRRQARRLAVEAAQIGVPAATVHRWMDEALAEMAEGVADRDRGDEDNRDDGGGDSDDVRAGVDVSEEVRHDGDGD
jgi:GntR family transcriptional regulator